MNSIQKNNEQSPISYNIIKTHLYFSVFYVIIAVVAGLTYSMQFIDMYPFKDVAFLSPGRVRMVHTQSVAYAWLANGLIGLIYYIIPKLTGEKILSEKLGLFAVWAYNILVLSVVAFILGGFGQALEWGETPIFLDPFLAVAVLCMVVNLITPIYKARHKTFYVSVWYILAALIWTPLVFVMGNFLTYFVFAGASGATVASMYIHDLVGLFVTPIGIALVYYLMPVLMKKPVFSHALSLIGFWGLAFFYPLNSTHHYLYSPIPMWAQYAGIVASVGVHVVVYTVVFNVIATMSQDWKRVVEVPSLKFILAGTIMYLITCIQCAIHVTLSVQKIIHFTDWVVGHSHFVLFGVFGFWIYAWIYYLLPRILKTPFYSQSMISWHFWLSVLGINIMFIDLLAAGVMQGFMWRSMTDFVESVAASVPFWWVRTFSGIMIFVGQVIFALNVYMTWKLSKTQSQENAVLADA